jgi:hypothetical protein
MCVCLRVCVFVCVRVCATGVSVYALCVYTQLCRERGFRPIYVLVRVLVLRWAGTSASVCIYVRVRVHVRAHIRTDSAMYPLISIHVEVER